MLESLESETPNIKDLSIEDQTRQEIPFDPDKEITDEDWQKCKEDLRYRIKDIRRDFTYFSYDLREKDSYRGPAIDAIGENCAEYIYYIAIIKIISPTRFTNLNILSENASKIVINRNLRYFKPTLKELAWIKLLDSSKLVRIDLEKYYPYPNGYRFDNIYSALDDLLHAQILFPKRDVAKDFGLYTEERIKQIKDEAEELRNETPSELSGLAMRFSGFLMRVKLLLPNFDISDLFGEADWSYAKERFKNSREDSYMSSFINQAFIMTILAAKRTKITEYGIELDLGKDDEYQQPSPPMPEPRRF